VLRLGRRGGGFRGFRDEIAHREEAFGGAAIARGVVGRRPLRRAAAIAKNAAKAIDAIRNREPAQAPPRRATASSAARRLDRGREEAPRRS
jgi:hypothetical protein